MARVGAGALIGEDVKPLRLVLVGPLPPPVGGATVLFKQLADELQARDDVRVTVINTACDPRASVFITGAQVFRKLLSAVSSCDVVAFHSSCRGSLLFGPIVSAVCHIYKKPWIFRAFGDYATWYATMHSLSRMVLDRTILRANAVLVETKSAVAYFRGRDVKVYWYANNRPLNAVEARRSSPTSCKRFVFVGHVKPSKGVRELIAAAKALPDATVDVYGPLQDGMDEGEFTGANAKYHGPVASNVVGDILRTYDAMVLPTYYKGEGYPGVILEAYAEGLPVITTRWRSIPEIVTERCGILVEPKDLDSLVQAMQRLSTSPELFAALRAGAKEAAVAFSSHVWTERFLEIAKSVTTVSSTWSEEGLKWSRVTSR